MRTKIGPHDTVTVEDLAVVGDLFYGERGEDGERPVLAPERAAVIRLTTDFGEVFQLGNFGDDFRGAEELAARIRATGSVNLDLWAFVRVLYGSRAYESYGEAEDVARERREDEDALWETVR